MVSRATTKRQVMLEWHPDTGLCVLQLGHAHFIKGHAGAHLSQEGKRNSGSSLPEFEASLGYMKFCLKTKFFRLISHTNDLCFSYKAIYCFCYIVLTLN